MLSVTHIECIKVRTGDVKIVNTVMVTFQSRKAPKNLKLVVSPMRCFKHFGHDKDRYRSLQFVPTMKKESSPKEQRFLWFMAENSSYRRDTRRSVLAFSC